MEDPLENQNYIFYNSIIAALHMATYYEITMGEKKTDDVQKIAFQHPLNHIQASRICV